VYSWNGHNFPNFIINNTAIKYNVKVGRKPSVKCIFLECSKTDFKSLYYKKHSRAYLKLEPGYPHLPLRLVKTNAKFCPNKWEQFNIETERKNRKQSALIFVSWPYNFVLYCAFWNLSKVYSCTEGSITPDY
jgi:hypothetical protein